MTKLNLRPETFLLYNILITERVNDHGVHDILIHFQEQISKYESKFDLLSHNVTNIHIPNCYIFVEWRN